MVVAWAIEALNLRRHALHEKLWESPLRGHLFVPTLLFAFIRVHSWL